MLFIIDVKKTEKCRNNYPKDTKKYYRTFKVFKLFGFIPLFAWVTNYNEAGY